MKDQFLVPKLYLGTPLFAHSIALEGRPSCHPRFGGSRALQEKLKLAAGN